MRTIRKPSVDEAFASLQKLYKLTSGAPAAVSANRLRSACNLRTKDFMVLVEGGILLSDYKKYEWNTIQPTRAMAEKMLKTPLKADQKKSVKKTSPSPEKADTGGIKNTDTGGSISEPVNKGSVIAMPRYIIKRSFNGQEIKLDAKSLNGSGYHVTTGRRDTHLRAKSIDDLRAYGFALLQAADLFEAETIKS